MVAIVLLPGMDGTGAMFAEFASALKERHRPIVVAYPADKPLDYQGLEAFVRERLPKDEPFVLLGESFSGPIAISLAASKPPGLIGLILCCTFASNPVPLLSPFNRLIRYLPLPTRGARLLSPWLFGRFATPALLRSAQQALAGVPAKTLRVRLRAVLEVDVSERLKHIDVPFLYLQALEDRVVSQAVTRQVEALAPLMRVVRLRGPHLLLQSVPNEAGKIVDEFITGAAPAFNSPLDTHTLRGSAYSLNDYVRYT